MSEFEYPKRPTKAQAMDMIIKNRISVHAIPSERAEGEWLVEELNCGRKGGIDGLVATDENLLESIAWVAENCVGVS